MKIIMWAQYESFCLYLFPNPNCKGAGFVKQNLEFHVLSGMAFCRNLQWMIELNVRILGFCEFLY